ncbi:MAG: hypothetical protein AAFV53_14250 [Myxococcota bacterium]
MLPERTETAEEAYLEQWRSSTDTDGLLNAITAAIESRRPQLAARLVGLLGEHIQVEPGSPVDRARRAAKMLMLPTAKTEDFAALQAAWVLARRMRMRRITRRMRGGARRSRRSGKRR